MFLLLGKVFEKLAALDVLHHQVQILVIVVSLKILDNVGVVELLQNSDLLLYHSDIVAQLDLI